MKKRWLLISFLFLSQVTFASFPRTLPADSAGYSIPGKASPGSQSLSQKAEHPAGKPLSFTQKLACKLLHRQIAKHKTNWLTIVGGFLLGFLIPLFGLGIAYLVTKNKDFRKWALIGLITYVTVGLFVLFLMFIGVIPVF